jgi:hypothetical protein
MNDVLPKPFTKEGMLRTLEKHLAHLKRDYIPSQQAQHQDRQPTLSSGLAGTKTIKDKEDLARDEKMIG